MEILGLLIAFAAGGATVIGTYFAFKQLRRSEPQIELVDARGTPFLPPEAEDKGYSWGFRLCLLNRRGVDYAVTDAQFRPRSRRLRRQLPQDDEGWHGIVFDDMLGRPSGGHRQPLVMKGYEYKELHGFWWNPWVRDPRSESARDYWRDNPEEKETWERLVTALHKNEIDYRLTFADGSTETYSFR